jgi:hypothetical protein
MISKHGGEILAIHETGKRVRWVDKERIEELTAVVEKLVDRLADHGLGSCLNCGELAEWQDCDKHSKCTRFVCQGGCGEDYNCETGE